MKQLCKSIMGVTLLEIMLVLAIAAMIIVMSVRYYQTATASQQANSILQQIQAITAIADGIAQGSGTYLAVSQGTVADMMPNRIMTSPWGSAIAIGSGATTSYTVTIPNTPANVCAQVLPRLKGNINYRGATCSTAASGNLSYTYDAGY